MAKTNFEVEASTAQAVAELRKMNVSMQEVVKTAAALVEKHKQGEAAAEKHTSTAGAGLMKMATGLMGMLGGAAALHRSLGGVTEELEKSGKAARAAADGMRALVGAANDPAQAREIEQMIRGMGGDGSYAERGNVVRAVRGQAMGTLGLSQQGELARLAIESGKIGHPPEEVAGLTGTMARFFPGRSPEQLTDLAVAVRRAAGVHAGDLTGGVMQRIIGTSAAAGQGPEQVFGTIVAALKAGETPRAAIDLIQKLTMGPDAEAGSAAERQLQRIPLAGRSAALLGNPRLLGQLFSDRAGMVRRVLEMAPEEVRNLVGNAPGALRRGIANVQGSPALRMDEAANDAEEATERERADSPEGVRWRGYQAYVERSGLEHPLWARWAINGLNSLAGKIVGPRFAAGHLAGVRPGQFLREFYGEGGGDAAAAHMDAASAEMKLAAEATRAAGRQGGGAPPTRSHE